MKAKVKTSRRKAKTARGGDVMDKVVEAATRLLSEHWLDDVSITEVAREAGVVRASLLLQFPQGWPDITTSILMREIDTDYVNRVFALGAEEVEPPVEGKDLPVRDRLFESFDTILTKAEKNGLLYPNLRSQMFVLGEENAAVMRVQFVDVFSGLVGMLEEAVPVGPGSSWGHWQYAADMLLQFTLDLAGSSSSSTRTFEEKREALSMMIDVTIAGLKGHQE